MDYQVTLICTSGQYRPVSTIVKAENKDFNNVVDRVELTNRGIKKICASRNWTGFDLKKYSYTRSKIRIYDKEKIEQENKERYEAIKEAKYASGEWKRPKEKSKKLPTNCLTQSHQYGIIITEKERHTNN